MFNEPFDEPDNPPPLQRGDKLFINDKARLQIDTSEGYGYHGYKMSTFFGYALAYKKAADLLVQNNQRLPDIFLDDLVLPIVFLYRHYVELMLKDLLIEGNKKYGKFSPSEIKEKILDTHNIAYLWQKLKALLFALTDRSEYVEALEACLFEFSNVDDSSMSFRYPVNKKTGQPILRSNPHLRSLQYIDVHHLAKKMESIHQFYLENSFEFAMK